MFDEILRDERQENKVKTPGYAIPALILPILHF